MAWTPGCATPAAIPQEGVPLVGRQREWEILRRRLEEVRQGKGGSFWLEGEAGIGKTALLDHPAAWAETSGFRVLRGRHIGHRRALPLHGVREALSVLFGITAVDDPASVEARVGRALEREWPGLRLHRRPLVGFLSPFAAADESVASSPPEQAVERLYHLLWPAGCGRWSDPAAVLARVPEQVARVIEHRLARLSPEQQHVLQAASALGEHFDPAVLAEVAADNRGAVLNVLSELEEQGLVAVDSSGSPGRHRYVFRHALFRQVLYDGMPGQQRRGLHLRAAQTLERQPRGRTEAVFEVVHHYRAAEQQEQAVDLLVEAGRRALAARAYEEARTCLRDALAGTSPSSDPATQAGVHEFLGDGVAALRDTQKAKSCWQAALGLQTDAARAARLCTKIGSTCVRDLREQRRWSRRAVQYAPADSPERARALLQLAWLPDPDARDEQERRARMAQHMAQALRILRHHAHDPLLVTLLAGRVPFVPDWRSTNLPRVRRLLRRALRLAEAHEWWSRAIQIHTHLAETYRGVDLHEAQRHTERALDVARAYLPPGHPHIVMCMSHLCQWRLGLGDQALSPQAHEILASSPEYARTYRMSAWRQDPQAAWEALAGMLARAVTRLRSATLG
ncbi:MAG: hypothetical protein AB1505_31575 [Candidatus Latescibacterota bacterium]